MSVHFSLDLSEVFECGSDDGLEDDVFEMNSIPFSPSQRMSRKSGISRSKICKFFSGYDENMFLKIAEMKS